MASKKKYWDDPFLSTFEGRVIAAGVYEGKPSLVLDETIFYPEGGGQLGDVGEIRVDTKRVRVVDTQIDDAGVIHHVLEEAVTAAEGANATCAIDVARRRDH